MSELKLSKSLAEFVSKANVRLGEKGTPGVTLKYIKLEEGKPDKEMSANYIIGQFDTASSEILKSLNKGDKFVVVRALKVTPRGEFWNLHALEDASTFVAKPAYTPGKSNSSYSGGDNWGLKVGAARKQAVVVLGALGVNTKNINTYLEQLDTLTYELVKRQQIIEDNCRAKTVPEYNLISSLASEHLEPCSSSEFEEWAGEV